MVLLGLNRVSEAGAGEFFNSLVRFRYICSENPHSAMSSAHKESDTRVRIYPLPLDVVVGILSTEDEKAKLQALSGQIYALSCIWVSEKTPSR